MCREIIRENINLGEVVGNVFAMVNDFKGDAYTLRLMP